VQGDGQLVAGGPWPVEHRGEESAAEFARCPGVRSSVLLAAPLLLRHLLAQQQLFAISRLVPHLALAVTLDSPPLPLLITTELKPLPSTVFRRSLLH